MDIKKSLKTRVENFLHAHVWDLSGHEYGGFLLKSNRSGKVDDFMVIPNISETPKTHYRMPGTSFATAKKLASATKKTVVVHFHSHPDPIIMSSADVKASKYYEKYRSLVLIMIAPTSGRSYRPELSWIACKGVKPVNIKFVK